MLELQPFDRLALSLHHSEGVYALLIGSGLSRAAGIPTGWEITIDLIRRLASLQGVIDQPNWPRWYFEHYRTQPSYSEILHGLAPTASERRDLLHSYIEPSKNEDTRRPTAAHRAIASLVVDGTVRVIVTTNFDRLIENALREAGVEPSVIASDDALVGATPLVHSRCTQVHKRAARHRQAELIVEEARHFAEGQAQPLVQDHGKGDGVRAEMDGRRTQRVGRLQRVPSLHATATRTTRPDMDAESTHKGPDDREVFLKLISDPNRLQRAPAVGTLRRQRRLVRLGDLKRGATATVSTIRDATAATGPSARALTMCLRKRRGLAEAGAPGRLQRCAQSLDLAPQAITFAFQVVRFALQSIAFLAQAVVFASLAFDFALEVFTLGIRGAFSHVLVMPESSRTYKYYFLDRSARLALTRSPKTFWIGSY